MNAMGHDVKNFIGVEQNGSRQDDPQAGARLHGRWARHGMAEMGAMEMPLPDNTLPMMTGFGQFGPIEMGGMFIGGEGARGPGAAATTRTRAGTSIPHGTVAYEFNGRRRPAPSAKRRRAERKPTSNSTSSSPAANAHNSALRKDACNR